MGPAPAEIAGLVLVPLGAMSVLTLAVYLDAKNEGVRNPSKWATIVLLTGGIGTVIYAFERSAASEPKEFEGPHTLSGSNSTSGTNETNEGDQR